MLTSIFIHIFRILSSGNCEIWANIKVIWGHLEEFDKFWPCCTSINITIKNFANIRLTCWCWVTLSRIYVLLSMQNSRLVVLKGHWTSSTSSPTFFPKKVGIFIPLEVLAWVKTACQVLRSRLTYFWRNMNISNVFYFSKSTSINTQYSSLWGTLKMMLFTKYLIKWKRIGRNSWNFWYWFDFKSSIELDIKR